MPDTSSAKVTPVSSGLLATVLSGAQGMINGWFGPGLPLPPQAPIGTEPRNYDYQFGYNLNYRPKEQDRGVSFEQLRQLADTYDILRLVIETRKDQVASIPWVIRPKRRAGMTQADVKLAAANDPRILEVTDRFEMPDQELDWQTWIRKLLEEVFVIDAPAILPRWTRDKKVYGFEVIDGHLINRVLDLQGRTPLPPLTAYQQIIKQLPAIDMVSLLPAAMRGSLDVGTRQELLYRPRNVRTNKAYGYSPVEQVLITVQIALRRQMSQLAYYTEGNVPEMAIGCPPEWTPEQISQLQAIWDSRAGDILATRRARMVPDGKITVLKDAALKDDFDEWLARVICYAFSVSPTWAAKAVNRATAQSSQETAEEEGLAPILKWIEGIITLLIGRCYGYDDIEFAFQDANDPDPLKQAQVHQIYLDTKCITRNDVRDDLGLDPIPGGDEFEETAPLPPVQEKPPGEKLLAGGLVKAKKKDITASASDVNQLQAKLRKKMAQAIGGQFDDLAPEIARAVEEDFINGDTVSQIIEALNLKPLDALAKELSEPLARITVESSRAALDSLDITDEGIFDLINKDAIEYAGDRAAEMVGRKWIDGELVDNPNARWAITDSTRDSLKDLVTRAYSDGMSPAQLKTAIIEDHAFSPARAKLIAKTETAKASVQGSLNGWKRSGVVQGKESITSGDHDSDDECDEAEDAGVIDLDDDFPSGDDGPPFHPGCNCLLRAVLIDEDGNEDGGDEE